MMKNTLLAAVVSALLFIGPTASADVLCTFKTLSTSEEVMRLAGTLFRVTNYPDGLHVEMRFADGSWSDYGKVLQLDRPGFTVFLHLPDGEPGDGWVLTLTVTRTGTGSLMIHHGGFGNLSQLRRAWLYQGSCEAS